VKHKGAKVCFNIDHIDPLGQGVSREGKAVTFIAGTLPGETGQAVIYKKSKGVQFARLETLASTAGNRCEPKCPHFSHCPGCHYLHTDYNSELAYKRNTLARNLTHLNIEEDNIEVVPAPRREAYRNRVQLHYRHKYIGMLDPVSNQVVEIPHCRIMRPELRDAFAKLYEDRSWTHDNTGHGHCELYIKGGEVSQQWNQAYAHGGFSQVYSEMNEELQTRVQAQLHAAGASSVLDLFSGRGNLTETFFSRGGERVMIDSYWGEQKETQPDNFAKLDLYDDDALKLFTRRWKKYSFDTVLVDPPRRGFPQLDSWVKRIKPQHLLYVSCNPASLARDLGGLTKKYQVETVQLLDMFPSTYHFETLVHLRFRH